MGRAKTASDTALTTLITLTRAREVFLNYACQPTTGRHWPRLDQLTLMAPASLPLRLATWFGFMSYGVTPQLRAPLQKPGRDLRHPLLVAKILDIDVAMC